jgi:hypothetical protein
MGLLLNRLCNIQQIYISELIYSYEQLKISSEYTAKLLTTKRNKPSYVPFLLLLGKMQIRVAVRSKAWVCGCSLTGIVGSNPAEGMDVCLLWVLCVVRSLRRAGPSSRGVLPSVMCLSVMVKPRTMRRPRPPRGCRVIEKNTRCRKLQVAVTV